MSSADEKPQDSLSEDSKEVKGNANEAEEEEVLGFDEVMDSINNMIETSEVLLGGENDKGYKPRQALFACLTCRNETGKSAGVCFGCSVNCHDGHQIVELYSKRKFKCDCGNSKFNTKCKLYEEKDAVNEYNTYNDNYEGNFCLCKKPYTPEDCTEDMVQCELCEDWFHLTHLNMTAEEIKNMEETEETTSLVCGSCTKTNPFLTLLNKSEDVVCLSSGVVDGEIDDKRGIYINNLRKKLCKCAGCEKLYDRQAIEYLIDPEDEIAKFEQDNKEKAAASKPTEQEEFNALVGELGRDGAVMVLQGINNLKRKLADWAKEKKGEVIKSGDVTEFFDRLNEEQAEKRARMFE